MATHQQKVEWWGHRICGQGRIDVTYMGRWPVRIQPEMRRAVELMEQAFLDNGYQLPIGVTGSYACRKISGTNTWSLHSVPIAIDHDYANNPHLHEPIPRGFGTDPRFLITEAQVDAIEAIVNVDGDSIWKWLGWSIGDTMHFEIDVPPDKCEPREDDMTHFKIGEEYAEYEPVTWLLYQLMGGQVDPNANSSQVQSIMPWKTNVRLVQEEDFDKIAEFTGMSASTLERMKFDGLYRAGKEIASLEQSAWAD